MHPPPHSNRSIIAIGDIAIGAMANASAIGVGLFTIVIIANVITDTTTATTAIAGPEYI